MKKLISLIILCFTVALTVKSQDYTGYTHCAEQDSLALVAFYYATDGPNWKSNSDTFDINTIGGEDDYGIDYYNTYPNAGKGKWLEGPVKDWFGVLLEKQALGTSGDSVWRVVHITPVLGRRANGNNSLKGYLPKELGLLTALKWFRVNGNNGLLGSDLPDEAYHSTLTKLDVENALLGGIISNGFRNCTNLQIINLRYNSFDSIPVFDFFTTQHLLDYFAGTNIFLYSTHISYATWEPSVDYFRTFTTIPTIKYQIQNQALVGRAQEILANPGDNVTLVCNEAGKHGKCTWEKKGMNTYKTGTTYTITNIAAKDTGIYRGILTNDTIAAWQVEANSGVASVYTKPMHVVFVPDIPACKSVKTSYSGNEIYLTFSKVMALPNTAQTSQFSVLRNGNDVNVMSITRTGRLYDTYVITLDSSLYKGDTVLVSYTQGDVSDRNGGLLSSFSNMSVQNLVRKTPVVVNAVTRSDGEGILVKFDQYIDGSTLAVSDFTLTQSDDVTQSITSVVLYPGDIDNDISRSVELILADPLENATSELTVRYKKGSMAALYGAAVQSFGAIAVQNAVSLRKLHTSLHFIDECAKYKNIYVAGTIKSTAVKLYDDGTHGDAIANDYHWTRDISFPSGTYNWSVYQRTVTQYDTVYNDDQIILTPHSVNDSLISSSMMIMAVDTIIGSDTTCVFAGGDTVYYTCNKSVVFILDMKTYSQQNPSATIEPYLMGLNDDWKDGLKMDSIGSYTYSIKVDKYNIGDVIKFNFRNGAYPDGEWENVSPQNRTHTVQGNDTIRVSFGSFTTEVNDTRRESINIYPNPTGNWLYTSISGYDVVTAKIYNLYGQCVLNTNYTGEPIDVGMLSKGLYILEFIDKSNVPFRCRFIKK